MVGPTTAGVVLHRDPGYAPAEGPAVDPVAVAAVQCVADAGAPYETVDELRRHAAAALRRRVRRGLRHRAAGDGVVVGVLVRVAADGAGGGLRVLVDDGVRAAPHHFRLPPAVAAATGRPLYPGQVAAVRWDPAARGPEADRAAVAVECLPPPAPAPAAARRPAGPPVSVTVLCGPYDDAAGGPAAALARCLAAPAPPAARHLFLVCGPLVAAEDAPAAAATATYDDRLRAAHRALGRCAARALPAHAELYLVPACDDLVAPPAFPQPPYPVGAGTNRGGRPRPLPNPACLRLASPDGGAPALLTLAVCLYDAPRALRAAVAAAGAPPADERAACREALRHRTFAPLLPAPGLRYAYGAAALEWARDFAPDAVVLPPDGGPPRADAVDGVLFARPAPGRALTLTVAGGAVLVVAEDAP